MKKLIPVVCVLALCTSFVVCSVGNNFKVDGVDNIVPTGNVSLSSYSQNNFNSIVKLSVSPVNSDEPMEPQEFVDYLNNTYTSVTTPMGTIKFTHSGIINNYEMFSYDYWFMTYWSGVSPFDIQYSVRYTDEEKEETKAALRQIQKDIAADADKYLPGMKIQGGYYVSFYRYPYLQLGFTSIQFLTWRNYSGSYNSYTESYLDGFGWDPLIDDYDFTDSNDPVHELDFIF